MRYIILSTLLAAALFVSKLNAATVELDDGRVYSADVIAEDEKFVLIGINGARAQIPRNRIVRIEPGEVDGLQAGATVVQGFALPAPQPPPVDESQPVSVSHEPAPQDSGREERWPLPENPAERSRLQNLVQTLGGDDLVAQRDAAGFLRMAGDPGLAALITYGLYNPLPSVRTQAADLLGQAGGKRVLKYLIEAFYAAARPEIPPHQVGYVSALMRHITLLTGETFNFDVNSSSAGPIVAARAAEWWRMHSHEIPPQLGEPALDRADPQFVSYVQSSRRLNLAYRDFPGPSYQLPEQPDLTGTVEAQQPYFATMPRLARGEEFVRKFVPPAAPLSPPSTQRGPLSPEVFNKNLPITVPPVVLPDMK